MALYRSFHPVQREARRSGARMKIKMIGGIALTEAVLVALLLFLLQQSTLPDKLGVVLICLVPIVLCLHILEEFGFKRGLPEWDRAYQPKIASTLTTGYFVKICIVGIALALVTAFAAFDYAGGYSFFGIRIWLCFLSVYFASNALWHIHAAFQIKRHSPGIITGTLLCLPLTLAAYTYFLVTGTVEIFSVAVCMVGIPFAYELLIDYLRNRGAANKLTKSAR